MSSKSKWDLVAAGGILLLALFVLIRTQIGFGASFSDAGGIYPETLPRVYGIALLIMGLILAIEAWNRRNNPPAEPEIGEDCGEVAMVDPNPFSTSLPWGRIAGTLAALILYVFLLPLAPFLLITTVFLVALFVLYGHRAPFPIALAAFIGALAMEVLFIRILSLPL